MKKQAGHKSDMEHGRFGHRVLLKVLLTIVLFAMTWPQTEYSLSGSSSGITNG
jgi:hypothetical protein